jgi:hypothetical protein
LLRHYAVTWRTGAARLVRHTEDNEPSFMGAYHNGLYVSLSSPEIGGLRDLAVPKPKPVPAYQVVWT